MVTWRDITLLVIFLLLVQQICARNEQDNGIDCPTSSCGKIANISRPFRLKGEPIHCGDSRYELGCENDVTVLYLMSLKQTTHTNNLQGIEEKRNTGNTQDLTWFGFPNPRATGRILFTCDC